MIQDQLVDYISAQLKLGIPRDTVKSALVGVGWTAQDVEDTLKKIESPSVSTPAAATPVQATSVQMSQTASAQPQPQRQPMTTASIIAPAAVSKVSSSPMGMGGVKSPEPQMIRVSDLVSSSATTPVSSVATGPVVSAPKGNSFQGTAKPVMTSQTAQFTQRPQGKSNILTIVLVVIIVLLAGFSGYLLFKGNGSNAGATPAGVAPGQDQLSALQAQLQALNASNTALSAEAASGTALSKDLENNLALVVAVPALAPANGATSSPISLSGVLSLGIGKSALFTLTTSYGTKAYIKNSADPLVRAALQPLLTTGTVQVSGTFVPGLPNVTVLAVNGNPIAAPATVTSTTTVTTVTSTTTPPVTTTTIP